LNKASHNIPPQAHSKSLAREWAPQTSVVFGFKLSKSTAQTAGYGIWASVEPRPTVLRLSQVVWRPARLWGFSPSRLSKLDFVRPFGRAGNCVIPGRLPGSSFDRFSNQNSGEWHLLGDGIRPSWGRPASTEQRPHSSIFFISDPKTAQMLSSFLAPPVGAKWFLF
jgi:hypothetical protein